MKTRKESPIHEYQDVKTIGTIGMFAACPTEGDRGQYAEGYIDGWKKGQQHNPDPTGC